MSKGSGGSWPFNLLGLVSVVALSPLHPVSMHVSVYEKHSLVSIQRHHTFYTTLLSKYVSYKHPKIYEDIYYLNPFRELRWFS